MCVASSTSVFSPLYRSSCTCSASSSSFNELRSNSASAASLINQSPACCCEWYVACIQGTSRFATGTCPRATAPRARPRFDGSGHGSSSTEALAHQRARASATSGVRMPNLPLGTGWTAKLAPIALGEVRRRLKAARRGDVHDRHGGLQQQLARAAQPHLQVVLLWHAVEVALEQSLDLAARQARGGGDGIERHRPFDVLFHQLRHLDQALVTSAELCAQRYELLIPVVARPIDDKLLRDQLSHARAQLALDQVQHQVERRDPPGGRVTIAVDRKYLIAEHDARKLFAQRREILPVDRGPVGIEQPGAGQCVAAGAQRAQPAVAVCVASQGAQQGW